jgi:hypothetical protein
MKIKKSFLIGMLIENTQCEFDNGYNSAIIRLLKIGNDKKIENTPLGNFKKAFAGVVGENINCRIPTDIEFATIINTAISSGLLQGVKLLKEISGLGLKDSKDVFDRYRITNPLTNN